MSKMEGPGRGPVTSEREGGRREEGNVEKVVAIREGRNEGGRERERESFMREGGNALYTFSASPQAKNAILGYCNQAKSVSIYKKKRRMQA